MWGNIIREIGGVLVIALMLAGCGKRENQSRPLPDVEFAALPDCPESKPQMVKSSESGIKILPNRIVGPDGCPVAVRPVDIKPIPTRRGLGLAATESGYVAGRAWAEENMISHESECYSPSSSFEGGCLEYLDDQQAEAEREEFGE